jgi:tetratricopeptide (TPR) repeat protein
MPQEARFCGACGQPLGAGAEIPASRMSLPAGMMQVPLLHGPAAEPPRASPASLPPPAPASPAPAPPVLEPEEVALDVELDEAERHFQLVEVDALTRRGRFEDALRVLACVRSLPRDDPRMVERFTALGRDLGQALVARAREVSLEPAALRQGLHKAERLADDVRFRDALRGQVAPVAAEADVRRVRELLAAGHLQAAQSVAERVLGLGPRIVEFRQLAREVVRALVGRAHELQKAGDAALGRGDVPAALDRYQEALSLLENDRLLLGRVERANAARPGPLPGRPQPSH